MWSPKQFTEQLRNNPEGMARVRLGRGVLGNTTYAFLGVVGSASILGFALKNDPWIAAGVIVLFLIVFLIFMWRTHVFADKHPDMAMLGDTEWLHYQQAQMAARDLKEIPPAPIIEDPKNEIMIGSERGR